MRLTRVVVLSQSAPREIFGVDVSQYIIGLSHDRVRDTQTRQVARLLHMHRRVARLIGGTLIILYPFIVCTVERVILRRVSPRRKFTELRYRLHITAYLRKRER